MSETRVRGGTREHARVGGCQQQQQHSTGATREERRLRVFSRVLTAALTTPGSSLADLHLQARAIEREEKEANDPDPAREQTGRHIRGHSQRRLKEGVEEGGAEHKPQEEARPEHLVRDVGIGRVALASGLGTRRPEDTPGGHGRGDVGSQPA